MITDIDDKEFVYVPKWLARQLEDLETGAEQEKIILGYLDRSREEIRTNVESLEEDIVQYRGMMIQAKESFRKAKDEALESSYALWEKMDKEHSKIRTKVKEVKEFMSPLSKEIGDINSKLDKLSVYKVEKILELLEKIKNADPKTRDMVAFLLNEYKEKEGGANK